MNVIYPKWKEALLQGAVQSSLNNPVRAYLLDTTLYSYNAGHRFLSDVALAARVGPSVLLTNKTFLDGVLGAADLVFPAVVGAPVQALLLALATGTDSSSRLVAYVDSALGLPFTPAAIDQPIFWNALGIFGL